MLLAEAGSSGNFGLLFFVLIMFLGARQWIKLFKGKAQVAGRLAELYGTLAGGVA